MPDLAGVLVSAATSFGIALGLLYIAHRSGFTDVQAKLIEALKERVSQLEAEATRLEAEVINLERRYARLEADYLRLLEKS